jgi:hypothetical protein
MGIWSNAFKVNVSKELTGDDKVFLSKICSKIKKRNLSDIAVLIAESSRPVNVLVSNFIYFLKPTLGFLLSKKDMERAAELLENPEGLEFFKSQLDWAENRKETKEKTALKENEKQQNK